MLRNPLNPAFFYILTSVILGVCGQLLFKKGALHLGTVDFQMKSLSAIILRMVTSLPLIFGLAFYAVGTFFWIMTLSKAELSYAYPMLSIGYILIFFLSWILFKEPVNMVRFIGTLVICVGVYLVSIS